MSAITGTGPPAGTPEDSEEKTASRSGLGLVAVLWVGLSVSLLGNNFYQVGLTWNVTAQGGAFRAALLGATMAVPMAVLGLFAGVLVDRWSRPKTMVLSDLIRFAVVGLFGLAFIITRPPLAAVLTGAAVLAGSGVCFTPAFQAWLPDLFDDREQLVRFDSLYLGTISGIGIAGPAIAGLLYPVIGLSGLLLLDSASFAVSAAAVWHVARRASKPEWPLPTDLPAPPPRRGLLSGAGEGLKYIFGNPVLRPQFTVFPVLEAAGYAALFVLPTYLIVAGYTSSWLYGVLLATEGVGRVVGAWLIPHTSLRRHRGWVLATNYLLQGAALAIFCLARSPVLALPAFAFIGLPGGASQVALSSWVQMNVDRNLRGRVFGTLTTFVLWLMPLGPVVFGWLANWQGSRFALLAIAATLGAGGAFIASSRAVRELQ